MGSRSSGVCLLHLMGQCNSRDQDRLPDSSRWFSGHRKPDCFCRYPVRTGGNSCITVRIHPGKKSCPSGRKDIQVCYPGLLCSDLRPVLFLLHRSGTYIRCKRRDHHRPRKFYCNFNGMSVSKKWKDDRQKTCWLHPRICGSRDHQHGRRLYGHGIQADRRRLRADRAAFLWSVNRTDQYFLQKSITGYFKRLSVLHGRCVAVHSRNPDGRTLGSYVDCRSSIDSLPGNGIGCGVYTLVGSAGA